MSAGLRRHIYPHQIIMRQQLSIIGVVGDAVSLCFLGSQVGVSAQPGDAD
jgi:hypothetical protein